MSYVFADCENSDVIGAVIRGNQEIVNNMLREVKLRQNLTHKVKI